MKWVNHKLLTGSIVYFLTNDPVAALFATAGSILPDAVEGFPNESNYTQWRKNHRQLSHWFPPYLTVFLLLYLVAYFLGMRDINFTHISIAMLMHISPGSQYAILTYGIAFMGLGGCFHILQDAICGKVPSLNPKIKIGAKLFYVGSIKEYAYVMPISAVLLMLRFKFG